MSLAAKLLPDVAQYRVLSGLNLVQNNQLQTGIGTVGALTHGAAGYVRPSSMPLYVARGV